MALAQWFSLTSYASMPSLEPLYLLYSTSWSK